MNRGLRMAACLMNISEARNSEAVRTIADAASVSARQPIQAEEIKMSVNDDNHTTDSMFYADFRCKGSVLNVFSDPDYNRSVLTIAGPINHLGDMIFSACLQAFKSIDINVQSGGHPRLGSVDLLPIHPLSRSLSLAECGQVARELAVRLAEAVPGTSYFYFGAADLPAHRGLVNRRKDVNWYAGRDGLDFSRCKFDIGTQPSNRYGLTGIGAMPYMMNFNITLDTTDLAIGQEIASIIRATAHQTGMPGVQSMAFRHEGRIEIACNVETADLQDPSPNLWLTSRADLEERVRCLAEERNIPIFGQALVGYTPEMAYDTLIEALVQGDTAFWKKSAKVLM